MVQNWAQQVQTVQMEDLQGFQGEQYAFWQADTNSGTQEQSLETLAAFRRERKCGRVHWMQRQIEEEAQDWTVQWAEAQKPLPAPHLYHGKVFEHLQKARPHRIPAQFRRANSWNPRLNRIVSLL